MQPAASQHIHEVITHITRSETGKLTAVLTRIFGTHNLELAEDVVQDVLLKALDAWKDGIPDNPEAWLFRSAKNRAIDIIRKERRRQTFATDISSLLESEYTAATTLDECFSNDEIKDDQLRMMFACCHPAIAREGQIALILKTLCGFSIPQIARAFITNTDTIEKRLYRARMAFREHNATLELPSGQDLPPRLANIMETVYLLFNEAHSASYHDSLVREDLAADTIRLCSLLTENPHTDVPEVNALLALLYFHSARLSSRMDAKGDIILMKHQDRALWNKEMISTGIRYLNRSAQGHTVSRYHIEAAIAFEHCKAVCYEDTDWKQILMFYDLLKQIVPSPVVLLNRAIAVKELEGPEKALECIRNIPGIDFLQQYYLLHGILGELYAEMKDTPLAQKHYKLALQHVVSEAEKRLLQQRLEKL